MNRGREPRRPGLPFRGPVDLPGYRAFLAHEIAHQWWGHAVSAATYHDLWLSEGLSQYAAIRYLRMKHGNDKLPSILKKRFLDEAHGGLRADYARRPAELS